ncbi:transmembrane protein 87A-like [Amphiura filiformis]|uniref:transmembrane protein 87A-like n=1 Tax=Amphiura filiformis TaxID=82378 RepID=UPI003B221604
MIVGFSYFTVCLIEGCLSVSNHSNAADVVAILVLIVNVGICLWILRLLRQSMNQLKIRKNITRLKTYKWLTGFVALGVFANFIFLMWSTSTHKWASCNTNSDTLWMDDAYWSISSCILLVAMMILVGPKQIKHYTPGQYRFSALVNDESEDYEEDEESQQPPTSNDAFDSVKLRSAVEKPQHDDTTMSANVASGIDGNLQPFTDAFLGTSNTKEEQEVLN